MSNSVIHCVIDFVVKQHSSEKVRDVLLAMLEPTRKEDGCLKYKLFQNLHDQRQFTLIGAWENEDAFEDHLQSDHFRKADIQNDPSKISETKTSSFCIVI